MGEKSRGNWGIRIEFNKDGSVKKPKKIKKPIDKEKPHQEIKYYGRKGAYLSIAFLCGKCGGDVDA